MTPEKNPLSIRERLEELERKTLSPLAALSSASRGRPKPEKPCQIRPDFQHDRDRIVHSKAFRRLKHKTQVFLAPRGDHYRTRLTHTIEVSQIARTIAKALFLNEDLTEAIALGHDLGHTPFGHAGEYALNAVFPDGFHHWEQSLRVVDELGNEGKGLNLTWEVRDGILKHSKGRDNPIVGVRASDQPATLEGKIVRVADIVAYTNHDLQDAFAAGLLKPTDLPRECVEVLGKSHAQRIDTMVKDIIYRTAELNANAIGMSPAVTTATENLRAFLFERVYDCEAVQVEVKKTRKIIEDLYRYYLDHPEVLLKHTGKREFRYPLPREACDFIAGMSDGYALHLYEELFMPKPWTY